MIKQFPANEKCIHKEEVQVEHQEHGQCLSKVLKGILRWVIRPSLLDELIAPRLMYKYQDEKEVDSEHVGSNKAHPCHVALEALLL